MIKRKIGFVVVLLVLAIGGVQAQLTSSLRINEVVPNNVNGYIDNFGKRGSWIEVFNTSAGTVDIAGCYLTTDPNKPRMYMVSKGDVATKIKPRQRVLFWADNVPHHGVFHTNFTLNPTESNVIALYDASGKKLIDKVEIPPMEVDKSYGRAVDGKSDFSILPYPTPEAANEVINGNPAVEKFIENDPTGAGMSITAMLVVFLALIALYMVFKQIGRTATTLSAKRAQKAQGGVAATTVVTGDLSGEVLAAIAMAINEHEGEAHDLEDTVLTINKVTRNYSPWSSKIYGLRELPRIK